MRIFAFFSEQRALIYAESVLFVNDNERKITERNVLLDNGVSAYKHVRFSVFDLFPDFPSFGSAARAGKQRGFDAELFKKRGKGLIMLRCEHFRRRHHGGLSAALCRIIHRRRGNSRFSAADVALNKSRHRGGTFHIGNTFVYYPFLRAGKLVRQSAVKNGHIDVSFKRSGDAFSVFSFKHA